MAMGKAMALNECQSIAGNILKLLSSFYNHVDVRCLSVILCIYPLRKPSYEMRIKLSEIVLRQMYQFSVLVTNDF
jgi:hypothetical protein